MSVWKDHGEEKEKEKDCHPGQQWPCLSRAEEQGETDAQGAQGKGPNVL